MYRLSHHCLASTSAKGVPALAVALAATLLVPAYAHAADLCVDQQRAPGCKTTISAAVASAAPGDTIRVHPGIYHEDVVITIPLALVGQDRDTTIIDATGLANGIFVNGFDNPALNYGVLGEVSVSGFTVRNANFEGILAASISQLTLFGNTVIHNDQLLRPGSGCLGLPAFDAANSASCGQGVHLIGATHSSITSNLIEDNAGGILLSDETTTSHDDLVTLNQVENNSYAPGVTIISQPAYIAPDEPHQSASAPSPYGIYDITVLNNQVLHNGFGGATPGAGIALLAPTSGTRVYANDVVSNQIVGNAGAGIVVHAGAPAASNPDADRNTVSANTISQNGADSGSQTRMSAGISIVGGSPITDSLVNSNSIAGEAIAVSFDSASTLDLHLNSLTNQQIGVANFNTAGIVQAEDNWWGCSSGPGTRGCASVVGGATVLSDPWLTAPLCGDVTSTPVQGFFAALTDLHNELDR